MASPNHEVEAGAAHPLLPPLPIPADAAGWLVALRRYAVLAPGPEPEFDRIVQLAQRIFGVPAVCMSLVDAHCQWLKAHVGPSLENPAWELPFCAPAIPSEGVIVVPDLTRDAWFAKHPNVKGAPRARFYAAAPVRPDDGPVLGSLCLIGFEPREFSTDEAATLAGLAAVLGDTLALRLAKLTAERETTDVRGREKELADRVEEHASAARSALGRVRESESRLATVERVAGLGSWECAFDARGEADRKSCVWSAETYRLFGPPTKGVDLWDYFFRCVHPDDLPRVHAAFEEAVRTHTHYSVDHRLVRPDGVLLYLHEEADIVFDGESGQPSRIVGTTQDITARKLAEEALRLSEASHRQLFDNNPLPTWVIDVSSLRFLAVNQAAVNHYGYTREEFLQLSLVDIRPPEDVPALLVYMNCVSPQHLQSRPGRHLKKDGTVIDVEIDNVGIEYRGRLASLAVAHDVTEERRVERELRASEERFQRIVANVPGMVFRRVQHPDGSVTYPFISDGCMRIFGLRPEQIQQDPLALFEMLDPEDSHEYREAMSRSAASLQPFVWQGRLRRRNIGKSLCVQVASRPEKLPSGEIFWDGVVMDLTDRQEAEEHRRAKEEAERANAAKSEFLSRMSHELRTPLNAILGFGQVLQISSLPPQETLAVDYVMQAGKHLLQLVDEVLDLTQAETGQLRLVTRDVPLDALLRQCVGLMAGLAEARKIGWKIDWTRFQATLRCDEQRLRQIVINLLSNAVKYNREGGKIRLDAETVAGRFRLRVTDEGRGLSGEEVARLFTPFERLQYESSVVEGTGLGLTISRRLVEAMGGRIGVESAVGRGSTFWVELPLAAPGTDAPRAGEAPMATTPGPTVERVLFYVEDSASNVQVVRMLLSRHRPDWQLQTARTGDQALESICAHPPDLVLLDLQLPGMPGDEVMARLRRDQRTAHLPVVVLSADATTHSREKLLALGANDYLPKPFDVLRLLESLDRLVARSSLLD